MLSPQVHSLLGGEMRVMMTFLQRMYLRRVLNRIIKQCQPNFRGSLGITWSDGMVGPDGAWTGIVERVGPRWLGRVPRSTRQQVLIVETDLYHGAAHADCSVASVLPVAIHELNEFTRRTGIPVIV